MDGENNGKPNFLIDDLGGKTHYFRKHSYGKVKEGKRKQVENWWFGFVVWDSNRGAPK